MRHAQRVLRSALVLTLLAAAPPGASAQAPTERPTAGPARPSTAQRTIENLRTAIGGEANAAHRYLLFAIQAERDGHANAAALFRAAALAETVHERNHRAVLAELGAEAGPVTLEPVEVKTTRENLRGPIEAERTEESETYPQFARTAQAENIPAAVRTFQYAGQAEAKHEELFRQALDRLGDDTQMAYYVNVVTGDIVVLPPRSQPPTPKEGRYVPVS